MTNKLEAVSVWKGGIILKTPGRLLGLIFLIILTAAFTCIGCNFRTGEEEKPSQLKIGVKGEIESLNPMHIWSERAFEVSRLNYNYLLGWDEELNPLPELAHSWEVSGDGTLWTYKLNRNVTWHDGEPFTANDVKFTFDYIIEKQPPCYSDYLIALEEIIVRNDYTISIKTDQPLSWLPLLPVPILPEHVWSSLDQQGTQGETAAAVTSGTGPYRIVEYRRGDMVRLAANDDYFRGRPAVDEIIFYSFSGDLPMVQGFSDGQLDMITGLNPDSFSVFAGKEDEGIASTISDLVEVTYLGFNLTGRISEGPDNHLLNRRLREAIELSINRAEIVERVFNGFAKEGRSFLPMAFNSWQVSLDEVSRGYDPLKGELIFEEEGYTLNEEGKRVDREGYPLVFKLLVRNEAPADLKTADLIRSMLGLQAVSVEVVALGEIEFAEQVFSGDYDLFIWSWRGDFDPASILRVMTSDELMARNDVYYQNPSYDYLYLKQQNATDREERKVFIHDLQKLLYDDIPVIALYYPVKLSVYKSDLFKRWAPGGSIPGSSGYSPQFYENLAPAIAVEEKR